VAENICNIAPKMDRHGAKKRLAMTVGDIKKQGRQCAYTADKSYRVIAIETKCREAIYTWQKISATSCQTWIATARKSASR